MQVETADTPGQSSNITCFKAKLEEPLTAGSSIVLEWYSVHVGLMVPFPAKASQSDPQRVLLKGSHYAPSPYPVATQTTKASPIPVAHAYSLLHKQECRQCWCRQLALQTTNFVNVSWLEKLPPLTCMRPLAGQELSYT